MWYLYRKTRGPISLGMRMEQLFARLLHQTILLNTDKKDRHAVRFRDFLRFHDDPEPEKKEMTGEDLARMYGAVRKPNGK